MVDPSSDGQERPSEVSVTVADKQAFENYIKNIVIALDDVANDKVLDYAIAHPNAQESIKKFLSDGQCHALLVQKASNKGNCQFKSDFLDEYDENDNPDAAISYAFSTDVRYTNPKMQR